MQRINLANSRYSNQEIIATIGNFDGLHQGHIELLHQMNSLATSHNNAWRMLITFDVLPHEYFADKANLARTPRIGLLRDKVAVLSESGLIDEVVVLHFNYHLASIAPDEFISNYLQSKLNINYLVIGHDFRFGRHAKGNIQSFIGTNITTYEVKEIKRDGLRISSSLVRKLAKDQQVEQIKNYLGRNIRYTSRVVKGNQLARKFGMPTINLNLYKIQPVLWGIYVSNVYIDNVRYLGVTNIGKNPTVSEGKVYKIETHLLDVDLTLYGKIATVEILHFLRPELKFDDLDSLFVQMYKDLDDARSYFAEVKD